MMQNSVERNSPSGAFVLNITDSMIILSMCCQWRQRSL